MRGNIRNLLFHISSQTEVESKRFDDCPYHDDGYTNKLIVEENLLNRACANYSREHGRQNDVVVQGDLQRETDDSGLMIGLHEECSE